MKKTVIFKQANLAERTYAAAGEKVTFFWFGQYLTAEVRALGSEGDDLGTSTTVYVTYDMDEVRRIVRPSQVVGHREVGQH